MIDLARAIRNGRALHRALKARCPNGAFLTAHELIVQLQQGGAIRICRRLLDQMIEAPGDAVDRAGWNLAIFRIEQALGLEHHAETAAAQTARCNGPDQWAAYIADLRAARPASAEGGATT